jgi:hypothetical protein
MVLRFGEDDFLGYSRLVLLCPAPETLGTAEEALLQLGR